MSQSKGFDNAVKVREIVNAKDPAFGARGDGVTNDKAALDLAFAQSGRMVFVPKGTYLISSNLAAPTCYGIVGEGSQGATAKGTRFACGAAVTVGLEVRGSTATSAYLHVLKDFELSGPDVSSPNNAVGLLIGNSDTSGTPNYQWNYGLIDNVWITAWGHTSIARNCVGVFFRDSNFCEVRNLRIDQCEASLWCASATTANGSTNTPADVKFYNLHIQSQGIANVRNIQIASGAMQFFNTKINLCQDTCFYIAPGSTGACPAFGSYNGPPTVTAIQLSFCDISIENAGSSNTAQYMFYIDAAAANGNAYVTIRNCTTDSHCRLLHATGSDCHVFLDNLIDYAGAGMTAAGTDYIRSYASAHLTIANWGATNDKIPALSTAAKTATGGVIESPNWPFNYTASATGYTTVPTGTVYARKNGQTVTLDIPQFSAVNNAGTITLTGLPSILTPATLKPLLCSTSNNGAADTISLMTIATNGVMTFYTNLGGAGWAGVGTGRLNAISVTYTLD